MTKRIIRFGVIGCGLMGREFASAAGRWCHLLDLDFQPAIVAACDLNIQAAQWFQDNVPTVRSTTQNYAELLADEEIDAIYCAVPHNLHAGIYTDVIRAGKHLLGEKPFGIDKSANEAILKAVKENPRVIVRCSSEIPFFPGAYQIAQWISEGRFGRIIEVEAGFWHASDLNPQKPINWKRRVETNGEYGVMGDLGMHVLHVPLRFGWSPRTVRALLTKVFRERPDGKGGRLPCETWDNAILACTVATANQDFPMLLSTKRIAPGHGNTWFIRIWGTDFSAEFNTKYPKQLFYLPYQAGAEQAWHVLDVSYRSAYRAITGSIFEFGFSDSILQMWAAFCDEVANGRHGMRQSFVCATPEETAATHALFTAALESDSTGQTVRLSERSGKSKVG